MFLTSLPNFNIFLGCLLLGNTAWAQQEHAVFINAGQEKVQCFPDNMTSGLIGESSLKVMARIPTVKLKNPGKLFDFAWDFAKSQSLPLLDSLGQKL